MYKILCKTIALFLISLVSGCSPSDSFTIKIKRDPDVRTPLQLRYTTIWGNDTVINPVDKSKPELVFKGNGAGWNIAEITLANGETITTFPVSGGDNIKIFTSTPECNVSKMEGSKAVENYYRFISDNQNLIELSTIYADSMVKLNNTLHNLIISDPSDVAAAALTARYFITAENEAKADSILSLIPAELKNSRLMWNWQQLNNLALSAKNETVFALRIISAESSAPVTINPQKYRYTCFVFPNNDKEPRQQQIKQIACFADSIDENSRIKIVEISFAADSITWRKQIESDTVSWTQGWVPGGSASPSLSRLAVPRQPYYILVDSAGQQVYRGSNLNSLQECL